MVFMVAFILEDKFIFSENFAFFVYNFSSSSIETVAVREDDDMENINE